MTIELTPPRCPAAEETAVGPVRSRLCSPAAMRRRPKPPGKPVEFGDRPLSWEVVEEALREVKLAALRGSTTTSRSRRRA